VPQTIYTIGLLILSIAAVIKVLSENKMKKIDIIYAVVDSGYAGLAGVFASTIIGVPFCVSVHSHRRQLLNRYLKGAMGKLLLVLDYAIERLVYLKADKIIALSDSLKKYVLPFGVKPEKVIKIPVAISLEAFEKANEINENYDKNRECEENEIKIGYIGRLEREKNLFTLLRAFEEIVKTRHNVHLFIVGDGSLKDQLKTYTKTKEISNKASFLGAQFDIPSWLKLFDVFILPSFTEGMPTALLQAMAAGKAIIASDIPAIREIVEDGKEALLFNPYSPEQLKDAILGLYQDPKLRRKLGENAKKKAKQYDVNMVYPKIVEVYQEILRKQTLKQK
jgi:glycosyltransferase involved in cell wall biosynthesis